MNLIRLWVNGEERQAQEGASVADLLQSLDIKAVRVAVEHNRCILKRDEFASTGLAEGDRLEIVQFVGGG
ncbi:MAG: sulfur carrier protein ThiS [Acidobacteriota bacterium]